MIQFGIDRLVAMEFRELWGRRVGLFSNLSAVDQKLRSTVDLLWQSEAVNLVALFSPEHGFAGAAADGVHVQSSVDGRTGLPIHSLYGQHLKPTADMLNGLDILVCDVQDIGVRYYTFLWTLTHILEACGEVDLPVLILDRPNPLGSTLDGGGLDADLSSLVGRFPIPIQHGMSIGEVAHMVNARWNPTPAELTVLACAGWEARQPWEALGRVFVAPSPNMPQLVTAQHYPGACLMEGTTLSEGRGTALPFEIVGAPEVDPWALSEELSKLELPGVAFRPHYFTPGASKHAGQACGGVQVHITDAAAYRPLVVWLHVLHVLRKQYREGFWLPAHNGMQHFDRLIGSRHVRPLLAAGAPVDEITAEWGDFLQDFQQQRRPFLLYSDGTHDPSR